MKLRFFWALCLCDSVTKRFSVTNGPCAFNILQTHAHVKKKERGWMDAHSGMSQRDMWGCVSCAGTCPSRHHSPSWFTLCLLLRCGWPSTGLRAPGSCTFHVLRFCHLLCGHRPWVSSPVWQEVSVLTWGPCHHLAHSSVCMLLVPRHCLCIHGPRCVTSVSLWKCTRNVTLCFTERRHTLYVNGLYSRYTHIANSCFKVLI
jgi:hypothetical protein